MQHFIAPTDPGMARKVCGMYRRFQSEEEIAQRTGLSFGQVRQAIIQNFNKKTAKKKTASKWTAEEDAGLRSHFKRLKREHKEGSSLSSAGWAELSKAFPGRSADACRGRASRLGLKFGFMNWLRG